MAKRKRKSLPRGNLTATGNEGGRRARERKSINGAVAMGSYALPVASGSSVTAQDLRAGRKPGTGAPGFAQLPPEGPPSSYPPWWP